jgi:hypothetical protein
LLEFAEELKEEEEMKSYYYELSKGSQKSDFNPGTIAVKVT